MSATTTDIGATRANYVEVTGTTTITGLGTTTAGTRRIVRFTGALTLTHNATSLILPGAANITTVAGDVAEFVSLGSGNWVCVFYQKRTFTGSGSLVLASSPTIVTPTIASFTNAQHNHSNAAGGGQIANSGISGVGTEKLANPSKVSAYRNAAFTASAGAFATLVFDTELFDTGSNYDTSTGIFTAPIAGFYHFSWLVTGAAAAQWITGLFKNGTTTEVGRGTNTRISGGFGSENTSGGSHLIQLAANDTIRVRLYSDSANTGVPSLYQTYLSIFMMSAT